MAKKTRREKILADSRHITYHLETPAQESISREKKSEYRLNLATTTPTSKSTVNYSYVRSDLRKTALVTGAILITQLVLYFALNRA